MAGDVEIAVKVSINPYQEMDEKKLALMTTKEVGLKEVPKNKYVEYKGKFTVTTSKWNKNKLEARARLLFRYDLSLFASQVWQAFTPFQKAKNGQDKFKAAKAFRDKVKILRKKMEQNLSDKFEEFQEDIASGAADDMGELKGTRKGLNPAQATQLGGMAKRLAEVSIEKFSELKVLKDTEVKSNGEAKAKATEALDKALAPAIILLAKQVEGTMKGIDKVLAPIKAVPGDMRKSIKKEMSDAAIAEYKKSASELEKALNPIEAAIAAAKKDPIAALAKMKRKDFSKSTIELAVGSLSKVSSNAQNLSTTVKSIDDRLKKLEQAAKKR